MRLISRHLRLALAAAIIPVMAGCSGISASPSVSPASFFLPGLLKADPQKTAPAGAPSEPQAVIQVAQAQ
jgi:hypothetical protein